MQHTNNRFTTLWEANIGQYLQLKIQQGNRGPDDFILYVSNGKNSIWQAVDREQFLKAFNETRREPLQLGEEPIRNDRQLRHALRHALYNIIQRSGTYRDLYHDLPNALLMLAETERYVVKTRKQTEWIKK